MRSVPTIFPYYDYATKIGGHPIDRFGVVHGPSSEGKTKFALGLGLSFLKRQHFFGLVDAEMCYDADTEVLTRERGFVRWESLRPDEHVGCWDSEKDSLVYEKPFAVTRQLHDGPMYRVQHGGVDLLVTPQHKMFVKTQIDKGRSVGAREVSWGDWRLVAAEDLNERRRVRYRKHAPFREADPIDLCDGKRAPIFPQHDDSRSLLRLIGFFIGDGWVGTKRGRTNGISFSLKKARKIAFLREVCEEVGWTVDEMTTQANGVRIFVVRSEGAGRFFRSQFYDEQGEKMVPGYLLDLNVEDAEAVLEGLRASDGTAKRGAWEFSTSSDQVAEAVQRLVLHAGGAAHIGKNEVVSRVMVLSRMVEPIINNTAAGNIRKCLNTSWQEYKGDVFCAHTRTGVLVVRRNGKPVLSGNTTPIEWLERSLMVGHADNPMFMALRPKSYEQVVNAVREMLKGIIAAKRAKEIPEETSALIVVDSIRKLVPENFLAKIARFGAEGKQGSVDGMNGMGAAIKAKMNADWLDEVTPMLHEAGAAMLVIGRESENRDKGKDGVEWKLTGGKSLVFESSMLIRIERDWIREDEGDDMVVVGERHDCAIYKSKVAGKDSDIDYFTFHTSNGYLTPAGFEPARDLLELGIQLGTIKQAGSWFSFAGKRFQGKGRMVKRLAADVGLREELDGAIRRQSVKSEVDLTFGVRP